jgi:hypothetical protein
LDAIVRSWTVAGPQSHSEWRMMVVATKLVFESARDLLHVAVELDCALASAIVATQEARSAALSSPATATDSTETGRTRKGALAPPTPD